MAFSPPPTTLLSERCEQLLLPKMRHLYSGSVRCRMYFSTKKKKSQEDSPPRVWEQRAKHERSWLKPQTEISHLKSHTGDFHSEEMSLCFGVRAQCCILCVYKCVFVVMCATLCHHATVLLHSQGQAIIIAASDSIMIQFYLLHRGARGAMGTLEMDNLLQCQEMYTAPSFLSVTKHTRCHAPADTLQQSQTNMYSCGSQTAVSLSNKRKCVFFPPSFFFFFFPSCDVSLGRGSINSITLGGELASCYIRNMALWISH